MELNGEDKRIRALFCELKREEESTAPLFATTWNIAEAEFHHSGVRRLRVQSSANLRRFATAILLVSFVSLVVAATVLLPKYLRLPRQPKHDYAKQEVAAAPAPLLKSLRGLERFRLTGNQLSQLIGWWQFREQSALRNHRSHLLSVRRRSKKTGKTGKAGKADFPSGSRQPRNRCAQPAMNC